MLTFNKMFCKTLILSLFAFLASISASAQSRDILKECIYTPADSARVVRLLAEKAPQGGEVLYYARKFLGVPYVAATLERSKQERLIINLKELDCSTLAETVLALAATKRAGGRRFEDYCHTLMQFRYRGGRPDGYVSRLHYFTWWANSAVKNGLLQHVDGQRKYFSKQLVPNVYYMSANADKYPLLKGRPARIDSIARLEKAENGKPLGYYIPQENTGLGRNALPEVRDGDLIGIVTNKKGLDCSHLGFAVWGKDGKLHLLNASSIHKKVVEEPKTLRQYLSEHPSSIGIIVYRLTDNPLKTNRKNMTKVYVMSTCPDCAVVKELAKEDSRFELIDLGEHVRNLKAFLRLRDTHPAFEKVKARGSIGIPCFLSEDGSVSFSLEDYFEKHPDAEPSGEACSLDGKGC